jgi:hypothetical protein
MAEADWEEVTYIGHRAKTNQARSKQVKTRKQTVTMLGNFITSVKFCDGISRLLRTFNEFFM